MAFKMPSLNDLINPINALNQAGMDKIIPGASKKITSGFEDLTGTSAVREAKRKDEEAARAQQAALDVWSGLRSPEYSPVSYENYKDVGAYQNALLQDLADLSYSEDPLAQAKASTVGSSEFGNISLDPRLQQDQYAALDALKELSKGGLNEQDKANLAKIQTQEGVADRGRREAILQNMGARGFSGSGQDLLAQLSSGQAATDRASQRGMDVAAMAEQRALDAIMKGSSLAGDIETRKFGQEAQRAAAEDAIRKFNAGQTQQVELSNVGSANERAARVAAANLDVGKTNQARKMDVARYNTDLANQQAQADAARRQELANLNVGNVNKAKDTNIGLKQQQFQNVMDIAAGKTGQYSRAATDASTRAGQEAAAGGAIRGAIIGGLAKAVTPKAKD